MLLPLPTSVLAAFDDTCSAPVVVEAFLIPMVALMPSFVRAAAGSEVGVVEADLVRAFKKHGFKHQGERIGAGRGEELCILPLHDEAAAGAAAEDLPLDAAGAGDEIIPEGGDGGLAGGARAREADVGGAGVVGVRYDGAEGEVAVVEAKMVL